MNILAGYGYFFADRRFLGELMKATFVLVTNADETRQFFGIKNG